MHCRSQSEIGAVSHCIFSPADCGAKGLGLSVGLFIHPTLWFRANIDSCWPYCSNVWWEQSQNRQDNNPLNFPLELPSFPRLPLISTSDKVSRQLMDFFLFSHVYSWYPEDDSYCFWLMTSFLAPWFGQFFFPSFAFSLLVNLEEAPSLPWRIQSSVYFILWKG